MTGTHFGRLDWEIVILFLVGSTIAGLWSKRFIRDLEGYLIAGRRVRGYLGVASIIIEQTIADAGGRFRRKSGDFCTINTLIGYPTSARSDRNGSGIGAADVQKGEFDETPVGVHANRAARRDRHHRHSGRHPLSGLRASAREGPLDGLFEQLEAGRDGNADVQPGL